MLKSLKLEEWRLLEQQVNAHSFKNDMFKIHIIMFGYPHTKQSVHTSTLPHITLTFCMKDFIQSPTAKWLFFMSSIRQHNRGPLTFFHSQQQQQQLDCNKQEKRGYLTLHKSAGSQTSTEIQRRHHSYCTRLQVQCNSATF